MPRLEIPIVLMEKEKHLIAFVRVSGRSHTERTFEFVQYTSREIDNKTEGRNLKVNCCLSQNGQINNNRWGTHRALNLVSY